MAEQEKAAAAATATAEVGDFASLLQKNFKPQSDRAREEVEKAVRTLAQQRSRRRRSLAPTSSSRSRPSSASSTRRSRSK